MANTNMELLRFLLFFIYGLGIIFTADIVRKYLPLWESLDCRPLPDWYDKAKIGIFVHWGVYSVPGFESEWFWKKWKANETLYTDYLEKNYPPSFTYQEFAKDFKAEDFDPDLWAELFCLSGAKYVVFPGKHQEGFAMWPSTYSPGWNSMDVGPKRDLVGDLTKAIKKRNLRLGLFYALYEWFHPRYLLNKESNFSCRDFVDNKIMPEMKELVKNYEPDLFWVDGGSEASDEYFKSKHFLTWLYNESPVRDHVVVNDRWGKDTAGHHGGFHTCCEKINLGVPHPQKWENCITIDRYSGSYRKNTTILNYVFPNELIKEVVQTVSSGGNIVISLGATKEGTIIPIFQERLLQLGMWLNINSEAIYGTIPWKIQEDKLGDIWYTTTTKKDVIYAILLKWPANDVAELASVRRLFKKSTMKIQMGNTFLNWSLKKRNVEVYLAEKALPVNIFNVPWAWVLKITCK